MSFSYTEKKRVRRSFEKISSVMDLPNLLATQLESYESFLQREGYDLGKLKILTPLIFLNISPLHHYPYNEFLYYLGKYTLFRELESNTSYKLKEV